MLTYRKGLLAAVCVFTLFYLLRSFGSSSVPPIDGDSLGGSTSGRSYPPQIPPKNKPQNQQTIQDVSSKPLRERLRYQFPYDLESKFPAFIWQTWKYSPASGEFGENLRPLEASWTEQHPGFIHEVVTDDAAYHLIKYLYASVPEVTEAYASMPIPVLKADFFRYLILLARGGIYSDIDTQSLKPTTEWLPENFDRSTVGLIVGIEADAGGRQDWAKWYSRKIQFCQWTIQAKPGHPALRDLVATITEDTLRMKKQGILKENKMDKSIVEFTGPAVFTDAIFSYFNNESFFDYSGRNTNISASDFSGITSHKKVGDVIVLPITSFSPGVEQMGAKPVDDPMAFVEHKFSGMHLNDCLRSLLTFPGVWKPESERMKSE
jgi:alpha 1,6-mannosyltransferase